MGAIASQITSLTIVYSTVYSEADQRKHQSSASLAFLRKFPAQMASNAENVAIWWRHHVGRDHGAVKTWSTSAALQGSHVSAMTSKITDLSTVDLG